MHATTRHGPSASMSNSLKILNLKDLIAELVFLSIFELANPFLQAGHHKAIFAYKGKKVCHY
jgi:hypothetical protein